MALPARPKHMISQPDADMGLSKRLPVLRSAAYATLNNAGAMDERKEREIAQEITPALLAAIDSALLSIDFDLNESGPAEVSDIRLALGRFIALAAPTMSTDQKREWIDAVVTEVKDWPYLMLMPVLAEARRVVEFPGKLVPWLWAQMEEKVRRLNAERRNFDRLVQIAQTHGVNETWKRLWPGHD